jgi:hypothetical protein
VDSASVSERLETCNRDKEQGDEKSTTLACARAGGRVTDEQRNKAKAARGVFAAIARRTRGGRGASLGTNSQPPFGIVPGRAAAKNLCPLCLFLLSVFADTFIERNKHVKHLKNTIPFCKSIKRRQAFHFSFKMPTAILYFLRGYPSIQVAI